MNVYGDAATDEMTEAHNKVVGLALNGAQTERKASLTIENLVSAEGIESTKKRSFNNM